MTRKYVSLAETEPSSASPLPAPALRHVLASGAALFPDVETSRPPRGQPPGRSVSIRCGVESAGACLYYATHPRPASMIRSQVVHNLHHDLTVDLLVRLDLMYQVEFVHGTVQARRFSSAPLRPNHRAEAIHRAIGPPRSNEPVLMQCLGDCFEAEAHRTAFNDRLLFDDVLEEVEPISRGPLVFGMPLGRGIVG